MSIRTNTINKPLKQNANFHFKNNYRFIFLYLIKYNGNTIAWTNKPNCHWMNWLQWVREWVRQQQIEFRHWHTKKSIRNEESNRFVHYEAARNRNVWRHQSIISIDKSSCLVVSKSQFSSSLPAPRWFSEHDLIF